MRTSGGLAKRAAMAAITMTGLRKPRRRLGPSSAGLSCYWSRGRRNLPMVLAAPTTCGAIAAISLA